MTHNLWMSLNERMHDYLSSVNLDDLVRQQTIAGCADDVHPVNVSKSRPGRRAPAMVTA
jgi:Rrf2 family transcriptional regulator, iron-sulfur cluster assembly transcription factor